MIGLDFPCVNFTENLCSTRAQNELIVTIQDSKRFGPLPGGTNYQIPFFVRLNKSTFTKPCHGFMSAARLITQWCSALLLYLEVDNHIIIFLRDLFTYLDNMEWMFMLFFLGGWGG